MNVKKIVSVFTAAVLAAISAVTAFGAEAEEISEETGASSASFKVGNTLRISKGNLLLYPYNLSPNTTALYQLENETKGTTTLDKFSTHPTYPKTLSVSVKDTYNPMMGCGSSLGGGGTFVYDNTAGKYDVIKVKACDFVSGLNADGSITKYHDTLGKNVTYKFTEQTTADGDKLYSSLFFESGGAVTCVTPDSKGQIEILASRNPAHKVSYSTGFSWRITSKGGLTTGGGGGTNRGTVYGLRMGDTDLDGWTDIDDVTKMQKKIGEAVTFNALQNRNGDFDGDGSVTITDVTILQRYLAEFDISQFYT